LAMRIHAFAMEPDAGLQDEVARDAAPCELELVLFGPHVRAAGVQGVLLRRAVVEGAPDNHWRTDIAVIFEEADGRWRTARLTNHSGNGGQAGDEGERQEPSGDVARGASIRHASPSPFEGGADPTPIGGAGWEYFARPCRLAGRTRGGDQPLTSSQAAPRIVGLSGP